jgi:hypothetical protein
VGARFADFVVCSSRAARADSALWLESEIALSIFRKPQSPCPLAMSVFARYSPYHLTRFTIRIVVSPTMDLD